MNTALLQGLERIHSEPGGIPVAALERAKISLIYNLGLARAFTRTRPVRLAHDLVIASHGELASPSAATLLASGKKTSAAGAAFANSAALSSGGRGDTLGTIHIGQVVTPALLALSEAREIDSSRLLSALVTGYEIGGRLDSRFGKEAANRGFRSTPIFGAPSAAAACASLLALAPERMCAAMHIATCMTGGLLQPFEDGSEETIVQSGHASQLGLIAALSAEAGMKGAAGAMSGRVGLLQMFSSDPSDYEEIFSDIGENWVIHETTYKPFPVCAFAQTPVYAGMGLSAEVEPEDIAELEVRMNPREAGYAGLDFTGPFQTATETTMSAAFAVAYSLVHAGPVASRSLLEFDNPDVTEVLSVTSVLADDAVPPLSTVLKVRLKDGSSVEHRKLMSPADYSFELEEVAKMVRSNFEIAKDSERLEDGFEAFLTRSSDHVDVADVMEFFAP